MLPNYNWIENLFIAAPLALLPLLGQSERLDLLDYYKAGEKAEVSNRLNGTSTLTSLTANEVQLRLSESTALRIALEADSTLTLTRTFFMSDTTSLVQRYDRNWRLLPPATK